VIANHNYFLEGLMGRFAYSMNASVDLRIEQVPGDNGAGEWLRITEELHRETNARAREVSAMVHGRIFYEVMEGAARAREDAALPAVLREYADIWVAKPKVLVSHTRSRADNNTTIISGDDAIDQLAVFRAETHGTISVGGAMLATQLLTAGLLDELLLWTHPTILGFGRSLFDDYGMPIDLELLEHRAFSSGVTMHHYAIVKEKEAH
jgi:dihydrofolate reductase